MAAQTSLCSRQRNSHLKDRLEALKAAGIYLSRFAVSVVVSVQRAAQSTGAEARRAASERRLARSKGPRRVSFAEFHFRVVPDTAPDCEPSRRSRRLAHLSPLERRSRLRRRPPFGTDRGLVALRGAGGWSCCVGEIERRLVGREVWRDTLLGKSAAAGVCTPLTARENGRGGRRNRGGKDAFGERGFGEDAAACNDPRPHAAHRLPTFPSGRRDEHWCESNPKTAGEALWRQAAVLAASLRSLLLFCAWRRGDSGCRRNQEDRFTVCPKLLDERNDCAFFGVFDGTVGV